MSLDDRVRDSQHSLSWQENAMDTTSYIAYIEEEITNNGQSQLIICLLQNFGDQEGKRRRETPRPFSGLQVSDTIIREKTKKNKYGKSPSSFSRLGSACSALQYVIILFFFRHLAPFFHLGLYVA